MPKYNLVDDENLEHAEQSDKDIPKEESDEGEEKEESVISDFILDDLSISDPDIKKEPAAAEESEYNIPPEITGDDSQRQGTPPMQSLQPEMAYQDEQLPGPNFKPFIWAAVALVAIVLGYLVIDNLFLSDQAEEPAEKVETPEERLAREREEQKQSFLGRLNQQKQQRLKYLTNLIEVKPGEVKYSSFLLYTNSLAVEAFAKDRSGLAKLNMQLKATPALAGYALEAAVNRPGTQGGVFTLYNYKSLPSAGPGSAPAGAVTTTDASSWLEQNTRQFGLDVTKQRQISSIREQMFNVLRHEYILRGTESACFNFLKSMTSVPGNYTIHKLALVTTDQRNIMKSGYQMTLIMDFYL